MAAKPVAMRTVGQILAFALLAGWSFVCLFPLYWMIVNSLETTQQIFSIPVYIVPRNITFEAYQAVWQTQFPHLATSLIIAVGTALLSILIATPAAYALAHFRLDASRASVDELVEQLLDWLED